jgi:hypothetical protein
MAGLTSNRAQPEWLRSFSWGIAQPACELRHAALSALVSLIELGDYDPVPAFWRDVEFLGGYMPVVSVSAGLKRKTPPSLSHRQGFPKISSRTVLRSIPH